MQVYGRVSHADEPYHRGGVEAQDANVTRLVELGVLPAGCRQLEGEGPLAKELWQLADWVEENFARKPDQMQQAIDRLTPRSRPSTNAHWQQSSSRYGEGRKRGYPLALTATWMGARAVVTTRPDVAYYYRAPYWGWREGGWVKSLLLFFDHVSILLPNYMYGRHEYADPTLVIPLEERGLLQVLDPKDWSTKR